MNLMNLVKFVFSRKKWFFCNEFEEYTSETPNVHFFIIISISHQALWSSVPSGGYVICIWCRTVSSFTRTKICNFNKISFNQNILRFNVPMEDAFPVHKLKSTKNLKHVKFDFLVGKGIFFVFQRFVHIHIHQLKNQSKFS